MPAAFSPIPFTSVAVTGAAFVWANIPYAGLGAPMEVLPSELETDIRQSPFVKNLASSSIAFHARSSSERMRL